jgi:hypothetical protein
MNGETSFSNSGTFGGFSRPELGIQRAFVDSLPHSRHVLVLARSIHFLICDRNGIEKRDEIGNGGRAAAAVKNKTARDA